MSEELLIAGYILLFIAIALIVMGSLTGNEKNGRKVEIGIGGFIGPIPFGWASSPEMLKIIIAVSAIIMIGFILMFFVK